MKAEPDQANGRAKIAEGREAEMFAWEDGKVLRLLRDASGAAANERQAEAMRAAAACGVRVPAVYGTTVVAGRPGLIMERIQGSDLLSVVGRKPWTLFFDAILCGEVHAQLNEATAPAGIRTVKEYFQRQIARSAALPLHLAEFALATLEQLPEGEKLCHLDFHPGNIIMSPDGPVVIDWSNVCRGDPWADVARTELMLQIGEPPPGSPILVRMLARIGGRILAWGYRRAYTRARSIDKRAVAAWKVPVAAARMGDGIESEFPAIVRMLEQAKTV